MMYSDLPQVVPDRSQPEVVDPRDPTHYQQHSNLRQVALDQDQPEVVQGHQQAANYQYPGSSAAKNASPDSFGGTDGRGEAQGVGPKTSKPGRDICRLSPRVFYIFLVVGLTVVVGAGVGGGVGGALANRSSSSSSLSSSSPSPSSPPATSTITSASASAAATTSTSVTTTEVAGPTSTLYRDCPSSNNTIYSAGVGSDEYVYRKYCSMSLVDDGTTLVNEPTKDLDSCISLCAVYNHQNATQIASGDAAPCNAVCWRNGFVNDDLPGQCFGSTTQNSSTGGFNLDNTEIICDAAGWINQT